mmetsp:Transcript_137484/g.383430  ORF Transcript_137484/g.383430 Transcript_137484/m.383430 type:complete len:252 (-) Transcript_137484:725-1480(-)
MSCPMLRCEEPLTVRASSFLEIIPGWVLLPRLLLDCIATAPSAGPLARLPLDCIATAPSGAGSREERGYHAKNPLKLTCRKGSGMAVGSSLTTTPTSPGLAGLWPQPARRWPPSLPRRTRAPTLRSPWAAAADSRAASRAFLPLRRASPSRANHSTTRQKAPHMEPRTISTTTHQGIMYGVSSASKAATRSVASGLAPLTWPVELASSINEVSHVPSTLSRPKIALMAKPMPVMAPTKQRKHRQLGSSLRT